VQVALGRFTAALPFRFGVLGLADVDASRRPTELVQMAHRIWRRVLARPFISSTDFPLRFGLKATVGASGRGHLVLSDDRFTL